MSQRIVLGWGMDLNRRNFLKNAPVVSPEEQD